MLDEEEQKNGIADLRVELLESLDRKINEEFDRAKELLSLAIGTGLKVLGGALVLLMVVITILGIKTSGEISSSIKTFTESEIKNRLENHSPTAEFQQKVDELYNQALIDSYLLKIERNKNERFFRENINSEDVIRLISILKDPESDIEKFSDSAIILRKLSDSTSWDSIAKQFTNLIGASEPEFSFMTSDQSRKEILIKQLSEKGYEASRKLIKNIALDNSQSDKMRISSIRYLAKSGDFTSIPDLEILSDSSVPDIKKSALGALAKLNPKNQKLVNWENSYLTSGTNKLDDIRYGLEVVSYLMEGNPKYNIFFGDDDPDEEYRLNFSKKILVKIFQTDMGFFSSTPGFDEDRNLSIALGNDPSQFYSVDIDLLFGRPFKAIKSLLQDYAKTNNIEEMAKLIKKITVRGGKQNIAILSVEFGERSRFITNGGLSLDKDSAQSGAGLYWSNQEKKDSVEAIWLDSSSARIKRQISTIENSEDLKFRLKTDVEFNQDQ